MYRTVLGVPTTRCLHRTTFHCPLLLLLSTSYLGRAQTLSASGERCRRTEVVNAAHASGECSSQWPRAFHVLHFVCLCVRACVCVCVCLSYRINALGARDQHESTTVALRLGGGEEGGTMPTIQLMLFSLLDERSLLSPVQAYLFLLRYFFRKLTNGQNGKYFREKKIEV